MRKDNLWISGERSADQLDRPIWMPEFERNHAQQVQGVDIVGRLLQRLAAELLGLVQPTGLVVSRCRDNLCRGRSLAPSRGAVAAHVAVPTCCAELDYPVVRLVRQDP